MKIYTPIGSKDRLFEMMENVNKIKLNEDGSYVGINETLESSFNDLINHTIKIQKTDTQTNNDETYLELNCTEKHGYEIIFDFKWETSQTDQDGVNNIANAKIIKFKLSTSPTSSLTFSGNDTTLNKFNIQHADEILSVVTEYADFNTEEPEIDETYMDAIKKIDSYPFGGTPRTMQTSKAYADEKPTNPKLRVNAPELEKIVDEEFIGATNNASNPVQTSDKKRSIILVAHDNLTRKKGRKEYAPSTSEINAEIQRMRSNGSNIGEQTNVTQVPTPVSTDFNVGNTGDMSQMAYDNLPQQNKTEIIEQAIDYVEEILRKKGLSRNELSNDQYVFYIKKIALIMHEKDSMRMNETKERKEKEKDDNDYPDPIGKKFKAKSTYPKPRKKPSATVKLDEIVNDEFSNLGITRNANATKQAKSDVSKHYLQRGDNYNASPDKWTKSALPYDTKFPNPDDPSNIEYSDLREENKNKSNVESDEIEQLSQKREIEGDKLHGGIGDQKSPKDFNSDQVLKGMRVEMEHTDDPMVALSIVLDHLTELSDYYDRLEQMEGDNQKNGAGSTDPMNPSGCFDDKMLMNKENDDDKEMTNRLLGYEPKNVGDEL